MPVGLPTDLCVKGYFADCSDTAAASRTAGVPEALFYRHLADGTGVRTLDCVYAEVDPVTQHGVDHHGGRRRSGRNVPRCAEPVHRRSGGGEPRAVRHSARAVMGRGPGRRTLAGATAGGDHARPRAAARSAATSKVPSGRLVPEEVRDAERLLDAVRRLAGPAGSSRAAMPAPRRRAHREHLPRCGRTSVPRGLAAHPAWAVVPGHRLPPRLHDEPRGAATDRVGPAGALPGPARRRGRGRRRRGTTRGALSGVGWCTASSSGPSRSRSPRRSPPRCWGGSGSAVADHDAYASVAAS